MSKPIHAGISEVLDALGIASDFKGRRVVAIKIEGIDVEVDYRSDEDPPGTYRKGYFTSMPGDGFMPV